MSQTKIAETADSPFVFPNALEPLHTAAAALVRLLRAQSGTQETALDVEIEGFRLVCWRTVDRSTASTLSPREHEIARLIAAGHPNKVIADVLDISEWTVCTHLRRMFAKLQVCSRAALVAKLGR